MIINGVEFTNDAGGIRRADGQPFYYGSGWGDVSRALKGDTSVSAGLLPEWKPYASQFENYNDQVAATENYDTGFGAGKWVPGAILGMAGLGLWNDFGGGLSNLFSGADASWGVNPQTGAGAMDLGDWQDWGSLLNGGSSLSALPAPTNLQDYITGLDATKSGTAYLNNLIGGSSDAAGGGSWLSRLFSPSNAAGAANSLFGGGGNSGLGALLGALAGGLGANSKPAGQITSVQDIPDYLKPYQSMNLNSATNNFGASSMGQSVLPGALAQQAATIGGAYLNPNTNPAFAPYVKDLMGQAGSAFTARYGATPEALNNSGNQEGFTRAVTAAALPLYNQAYTTERGNQVSAALNAPAFANNYAGATFAPNLAYKNLYTGPQATSQPYFTNQFGGALSGALAGSQFGKLFG